MPKKYKLAAAAGLGVLMLAVLFAGQALAQRGMPGTGGMMSGSGASAGPAFGAGMMTNSIVTPTMPGPSMMGGSAGRSSAPSANITGTLPYWMQGMMGSATGITGTLPAWMQAMMGSSTGITGTLPLWMQAMMGGYAGSGMMGNGYFGNGMLGNAVPGYGMLGRGMMGYGMMAGGMGGMMGGWSDPNAKPLTLDQAQAAAQKYIQNLPNNAGANLKPLEVMEFANGFYVAVGDNSGGAFEVLVDRYAGNVYPEPGPNMMWNTRYGMAGGQGGMAGMMGLWSPAAGTPAVSEAQARANAQKFLDTKFPGAKLPADTMAFPGYYTLDFEVNGTPAGMLSVNAYTGQVWYHTWHGQFLSERSAQPGA